YDNENDPSSWARGEEHPLFSGRSTNKASAFVGISDWEVGTYLLVATATDPSGKEVKVEKVFTLYDPEVQNTGFENEAFHVELADPVCEPGEKAVLLISSALPECRVLMQVERNGNMVVSRPFTLRNGQQRIELPVLESDRGGFTVHFVCVALGRDHGTSRYVAVPWTNKQLQVEWMSFRDKLLPGAKEEWRLKIKGSKKEEVAAQVLATMYDASLDQFAVPSWWMEIWEDNSSELDWQGGEPFGVAYSQQVYRESVALADTTRNMIMLREENVNVYMWRYNSFVGRTEAMAGDASGTYTVTATNGAATTGFAGLTADPVHSKGGELDKPNGTPMPPPSASPLRTDFRETAFFLPELLTDRDGNVVLRFNMPDALTRWNVMGLAHTKDLQTAQFAASAITQKPMMVVPNLPRFLRQGDHITLTAKVNVIEGRAVNGVARLDLFDPRTNAPVDALFNNTKKESTFSAALGKSAVVPWNIDVPEGVDALAVRITASGAGASDGEERVLPILTDKVLVTESVPIAISKAGTKTFEQPNLLNAAASSTLKHRSLSLEYTPNPAWYAV
ncbi:MAG TPA: alpha-2-macroglobulin family protein, partial [Flavobacteriales bacterium]|nr:alpha-2-macroglobulin family protein [Flavobacteriales bacterium]